MTMQADVVEPPARRPRRKRKHSAATSGRRLYAAEGDAGSPWSRRFRDLCSAHASDLGGLDVLSEAQRSLVRRASAIETELEMMEARLSKGEEVDIDKFTRSASHLRRIFETIGVERKPRDVTPTLSSYLSKRSAETIDAP